MPRGDDPPKVITDGSVVAALRGSTIVLASRDGSRVVEFGSELAAAQAFVALSDQWRQG